MDNTSQEIDLDNWGSSIINRVAEYKRQFVPDINHIYMFYSPLKKNPKLMIIGDNPGGIEKQGRDTLEIPEKHEYDTEDYKLAKAMRTKVLKGTTLLPIMSNSVKFNRIFFQTRHLDDFYLLPKAKEIEKYCKNIVDEIISVIQPQTILAESFGTFRVLNDKKENVLFHKSLTNKKLIASNRNLLLEGEYKGIKLIGINHPTGARGISNENWSDVNKQLETILG